jgi:hypothetical protein
MQPKRENQPTFFDLAVQQRGSANRVLETITREVDFTAAEERVSYDFWSAISGQSGGTSYINNAANAGAGVADHWNNSTAKQYSKNLDPNASCIELLEVTP